MNKTLNTIFLLLIILILTFPVITAAGQFKVVRIYDGDTLKAIGHDIEIKVRLVGIDAPETAKSKNNPGQPFSQKAKKYFTNLVLNKIVNIKGYGTGPYNRILGVVYVNGENVNLEMIKSGFAEVYQGKPPTGFDITPYRKAESEAQKAKRGMWGLDAEYVSPKVWRKLQKR